MSSAEDDYDSSRSDGGVVCEFTNCDPRFYEVDSPDFIPWWQDYLENRAKYFG